MTALERYKSTIRRKRAEDRKDSQLRMERGAQRLGMLVGLVAGPWLTMGRSIGPIPIGGGLGALALVFDIFAAPEGVLWQGVLGIVEGLGAVDVVGAVSAARGAP